MKYSVIIPVFDEERNIRPLYEQIKEVMDSLKEEYEIIFVDDGSKDRTKEEILKTDATLIELDRNYGQSVALDAGFRHAKGDIIITMDGDLQNDPKDIPKLLDKLNEGYDVVAGWRYKRKDPLWMKFVSRSGRILRNKIIKDGVHDSGCTLRVYRREFVENLELWGEMHRYLVALLKIRGARIAEIKVNHRARTSGRSKYNWKKSIKGFIDLIYIWFIEKYLQRPLHLFGALGLGSFLLGVLALGYSLWSKIFHSVDLTNSGFFVVGFFLIITGIILFSSGIILDILIRTYHNTSKLQPRYRIKSIRSSKKA